jgi:hypothetical protein
MAQTEKPLSEIAVLAGLRFEAHQASARDESEPDGAIYIEDGRKPSWAARGKTALDAAYALYLELANNKPPNLIPDHLPLIGQCNYQRVYDSEHDGRIPCVPKGAKP